MQRSMESITRRCLHASSTTRSQLFTDFDLNQFHSGRDFRLRFRLAGSPSFVLRVLPPGRFLRLLRRRSSPAAPLPGTSETQIFPGSAGRAFVDSGPSTANKFGARAHGCTRAASMAAPASSAVEKPRTRDARGCSCNARSEWSNTSRARHGVGIDVFAQLMAIQIARSTPLAPASECAFSSH